MSTVNPNEVINVTAQAMVSVASVSIMSSALGMMMASMTEKPIPAGTKVSDKAIYDMKIAIGADTVNKAIKVVGRDDMVILAEEVEKQVVAEMIEEFGEDNTLKALESAYPGDLRAAKAMANSLKNYGVKPTSSPQKVEQAVNAGKKRAKHPAQPQKDTKTGIIYHSKAAAGMAVAAEYGLSAKKPDGTPNSFVWYEVLAKAPNRFVDAKPGELPNA